MRELQHTILLAVVYVFIAAIVLSPICNYAHLDSALYLGDVRFIAWTLAWNNHFVLDLLADRLRDGGAAAALHSYFDANIFYPAPQALALNEHLFGLSLFTLPIYAMTRNPAFAYNITWFCSFPASALAMHWLAWRYTRNHLSALLAGAIYAFSFFKILHGGGHLHLVWTFWIPLAMLLLAWWWDRPRWLTAAAFAIVVTLQILSSWYIGALTLMSIVPLFVWRLVSLLTRQRHMATSPPAASIVPSAWRLRAVQIMIVVGLSAAAIWPFAEPYTRGVIEVSRDDMREHAARVSDYLLPPLHTWEGQLLARAGVGPLHPHWGERAVFLGYAALGAALAGAWAMIARWRAVCRVPADPDGAATETVAGPHHTGEICALAVGALFAFICSLGPATRGPDIADWTLFSWFVSLPGVGLFRAPARFALIVTIAVALLAACGAASWQARWGRRRGRLLTLAILALALSESLIVASPLGRPQPVRIPPMYHHLATLPAGPIVSLPGYRESDRWWLRADYEYYSTAHWHPIVNGYSRLDPPDHFWIMGHMTAFPGPNSAKTMRRLGVAYVVLHADQYPDGGAALLAEARTSTNYALMYRIGETYLFRVQPASNAGTGE